MTARLLAPGLCHVCDTRSRSAHPNGSRPRPRVGIAEKHGKRGLGVGS